MLSVFTQSGAPFPPSRVTRLSPSPTQWLSGCSLTGSWDAQLFVEGAVQAAWLQTLRTAQAESEAISSRCQFGDRYIAYKDFSPIESVSREKT